MSQRTLYVWALIGLGSYVFCAALAGFVGLFVLFDSFVGQGLRGYGNSVAAVCIWAAFLLGSLGLGIGWIRSKSHQRQGFALGLLVGLAITALLLLQHFVSW
ncbi:hypothetical protein ACIBG8_40230 [Nonomuraea sp. NPDC050556]|uniref:hypothetical protein n=1 Tax=Nonomuraea sp. NPDC050556 TaxID=3364369 RepID=UPI00378CD413